MKRVVLVTSTQREMKMISMRKIALMTDNETLADLQNKVLRRADNIQKLTEVGQINLENEWTEFIKNLVDYGNKHYLSNFSLRLEMDESDGTNENLGGR
jgi:MoxR-like ATPase